MNTVFGKRLKELRLSKSMTQSELAIKFNVSKTTICQWETSKQEPSISDILRLADFFDTSTDYLLGKSDIF